MEATARSSRCSYCSCETQSALGDEAQLAAKDLGEEVARPAGRLEELHVQGAERVGDQVEHRIDLALVGEHLGEVTDAVAGAHLAELRLERGEDGVVAQGASLP